ncbi:MAG: thiol-disulfide oxidoreductase DCC family protein [Pseudomonadota bacterium]
MDTPTDTLFYDGRCPLCSVEINHLRRMSQDRLAFVDIHSASDLPLDREALLGVLHLRTADGEWLRGIDASVQAWAATRIGWLWRVLRWPLIRVVADAAYRKWAEIRYRRLYGRECPASQEVCSKGNH